MRSKLFVCCLFICHYVFAQTKTNWSPEQCLKMKNITSVVPSPDGSKVLYTVREAVMGDDKSEYVNQVFLCNSNGSNTTQLTKGDKNSAAPQWSPDGKWISFTSSRDGKNNLYLLPVGGGESEKITDVKTAVGNYKWSNDGNMIAYVMADAETDADEKNKKGKNDWYYMDENIKQNRLYVVWLNEKDTSGKRKWKKLTTENYNVNAFDWSPDGKTIAFSHGKSPLANETVYSDISVVDIESAKAKIIINTPAGETNPQYSPDGKWIAYISTDNPVTWPGPKHAAVYSVSDGKKWRLAATPDENGGIVGWAADGQSVLWSEANKTLNGIYVLSADGKSVTEWTKGIKDHIGGAAINFTGTHIGFVLQNPSTPHEAYISPVSSFTPQKITSVNAEIAKNAAGKTELIKWKSFDGKEIEGLLTYPLHYEAGKKYPMILNVHGGPAGVFQQSFIAGNQGSYPIAAFSEMDVFVLRPNPRGSSGYGTAFRMANQRDWGGGDFKDLMTGVDYVLKTGMVDENKLGVMGWSYGGFMSSWIVGHTDRFKAASIGAPVVDLVYQNLTDDIAGFLPSYMKADPWNDWAVYDKWSPLRYVQNVKTPVMLQHGEADQRVPFHNAVMFYHALQRRGVPVRLLALPRQPHGPTEPKMVLKTMQSNVEWFKTHLLDQKGF